MSASKAADIVDTAVAAGSFNTLVAAVKAADLVGTLKSPGPFTVFAPTDAAFKKLPKGTLASLLKPGVEQRRISRTALTANDVLVVSSIDFPTIMENILKVLPNTSNVAVVIGNSPNEQYWLGQIRADLKPFEGRVGLTFFNDLPFEETLQRAASLPPNTAIFIVLMSVDAAGLPHEEGKAMARLRAVTNAPIFSYNDFFLGQGIVGGPLIPISAVGREAASAAVRILRGQVPADISTSAIPFAAPSFDWRELLRWNISESQLPPGSQVLFRVPGLWEQHRPQMTAILAAILLQGGIIFLLLVERRRRRFAQAEASDRRREASA